MDEIIVNHLFSMGGMTNPKKVQGGMLTLPLVASEALARFISVKTAKKSPKGQRIEAS